MFPIVNREYYYMLIPNFICIRTYRYSDACGSYVYKYVENFAERKKMENSRIFLSAVPRIWVIGPGGQDCKPALVTCSAVDKSSNHFSRQNAQLQTHSARLYRRPCIRQSRGSSLMVANWQIYSWMAFPQVRQLYPRSAYLGLGIQRLSRLDWRCSRIHNVEYYNCQVLFLWEHSLARLTSLWDGGLTNTDDEAKIRDIPDSSVELFFKVKDRVKDLGQVIQYDSLTAKTYERRVDGTWHSVDWPCAPSPKWFKVITDKKGHQVGLQEEIDPPPSLT